jgi:hypothetical protein
MAMKTRMMRMIMTIEAREICLLGARSLVSLYKTPHKVRQVRKS